MLQPGTQVGRYEIQRRLGRGGMGTVYVAHDPVLGRMVAIKVFLSDLDLPDAAERFTREARSAAALNHANIVTIHDYGEFSSQPYIVMEYIQGETLTEVIRRKAPVSPAEKLRWIEELCTGVAYAHQVGVIHRDIKPTNLMIDRSGRLKILDFGIARMLGSLASHATALIGTPGYMAPEQILGGTIDYRSDLFSIGVVSYELLSYAEAFPGDTLPAITHRILSDEPVPLTQLVPDINLELVDIVERSLKKSAEERFADAESLRVAISAVRRQFDSDSGGWDATCANDRARQHPFWWRNQARHRIAEESRTERGGRCAADSTTRPEQNESRGDCPSTTCADRCVAGPGALVAGCRGSRRLPRGVRPGADHRRHARRGARAGTDDPDSAGKTACRCAHRRRRAANSGEAR